MNFHQQIYTADRGCSRVEPPEEKLPLETGDLWGCSSVDRASDRHAAEAGSIPRCGKGFFFPGVNFQCRLSDGVRTFPCATACINICAHVKEPVVPVRVRWILETPKHQHAP